MSVLTEKWLWIIILALFLIVIGPLFIVWFILLLPFPFNTILTFILVIGWGIAAGYKEWIIAKNKEKEKTEGKVSAEG